MNDLEDAGGRFMLPVAIRRRWPAPGHELPQDRRGGSPAYPTFSTRRLRGARRASGEGALLLEPPQLQVSCCQDQDEAEPQSSVLPEVHAVRFLGIPTRSHRALGCPGGDG